MRKLIAMGVIVMMLGGISTTAFSWGEHYHYREGRYYRDAGWWGLSGFVAGLTIGSYVASLPPSYETVVIGGVPYYYADGYYYQEGPGGYVIVAPPASIEGPLPIVHNSMPYILGTLFGILLLLCIGVALKKLLVKEGRTA